MSPDTKCIKNQTFDKITISENDQIVKIMQVLGKDNVDMSYVDGVGAKYYGNMVRDTIGFDSA